MAASERIILIDGSGFIFRAYHSLPPLTRPDGTPVGAVYGFINMLLKFLEGNNASHIAVLFDAKRKNFRNDIYPEYKAHRPDPPEDLIPQFPLIRDATTALGFPAVEMEGYEADDLIATYARQAHEAGMAVTIVSSDKDLMQLIRDGVQMWEPMKNVPIGKAEVLKKFGVPPEKVVDAQSLIGDSTDNVPGVPGIGPKTAAELITTYGDLEGVLAHTDQIKQNKRREMLQTHAEQARISRKLVILDDDVPVEATLDDFTIKTPDANTLIPFLQEQAFHSLVTRSKQKLGLQANGISDDPSSTTDSPSTPAKKEYTLVTDAESLQAWIAKAERVGSVAFDTETTGLDSMQAELVGFSLCVEAGKACYVPVGHIAPAADLLGAPAEALQQINKHEAIALIKPLLENPAVLKIGQNIKYDIQIMRRLGVSIAPITDTMLMSYVLDAGLRKHNMDDLAKEMLGIDTIHFKDVVGTGKKQITFAEVPLEKACEYAAEDADITLQLYQLLHQRLLHEHMFTVYERLERPLVPVIAGMEAAGIKADPQVLQALTTEFTREIQLLADKIYALAGEEFTIGSPKQLGEILFGKLGIPGGKKSKSGAYATGADILEELAAQGHELPARVLEWRGLTKLTSTYTEALARQINPYTKRVHTSFSLAATSTGRLSSSDPNLQNIPIRTEQGKRIRTAFVAEKGNKLISADYSQIELRLLAHIAGIDALKQAFQEGKDIHAVTAGQVFGMAVDDVNGDARRKAKTINFGIIYGISAHGLATRLGIGRGEAKEYIERYFEQYPGIRKYMEAMKEQAREKGYVTTLYGRRCHLPDINAKNGMQRAFSERAAINAPLQGTAADIIKRAMLQMPGALEKARLQSSQMLLQVHDELIVEAPEADVERAANILRQTMESAASLSVPLKVETGIGDNWGEIH